MNSNIQLSEELRYLMLKVIDGDMRLSRLIFDLYKMYPRCHLVLKWLIINKIVGDKLFLWLRNECQNSPLSAVQYILSKYEGDRNFKVIYGKDFI